MGLERALRLIFEAALRFGVAFPRAGRKKGIFCLPCAVPATGAGGGGPAPGALCCGCSPQPDAAGHCCLRAGRSRGVCVPAPLLLLGSRWAAGLMALLAKCRLLGLRSGSSCCCEPRAGSELKTWDRRGEALGSPSSAPRAEGPQGHAADPGHAVLESTSRMGLSPLASPALCVSAWTIVST